MSEPDYVVLRAAPDAPDWFLPPNWDGRWLDRAQVPTEPPGWTPPDDGTHAQAEFAPTGRFEVRDYDGAVAEVFEAQYVPPVCPGEETTPEQRCPAVHRPGHQCELAAGHEGLHENNGFWEHQWWYPNE